MINRLRFNLGLEDNSQVEVNFHIDTDDDDTDDGIVTDTPPDTEDEVDTTDAADNDIQDSSDEVEQLEEAKDSLESLSNVMSQHIENGTMSRMGLSFYKTSLEAIAPPSVLSNVGSVSLESCMQVSKNYACYMAQTELDEVRHQLNVVSTESIIGHIKKIIHNVDVLFRAEKALAKRANGLKQIAATSRNEHASNDEIEVNGKKSPDLSRLLTVPFKTEKDFLIEVKKFTKLYVDMTTVKGGFDDAFVDNLFPGSDKWKKNAEGKPTITIFGMRLIRDKTIIGYGAEEVTDATKVPNLSPAICTDVLEEVIAMLSHGDIMRDNAWTMYRTLENNIKLETSTSETNAKFTGAVTTTHTKEEYDDGMSRMYKAMDKLYRLKNKIVTEILNYVNFSLTDREFN